MLTEVGLDRNTTQFITAQAFHAKKQTMGGATCGHSVNRTPIIPQSAPCDSFTLFSGQNRQRAGSMPPPVTTATSAAIGPDGDQHVTQGTSGLVTMGMPAFAQGNVGHGLDEDAESIGESVASTV